MKYKQSEGFTLVEVIVTLVILAILAAVTIPSLAGFIADANAKDCKAKMTDLAKAYINERVNLGKSKPTDIDLGFMTSILENRSESKADESGAVAGLCPDGGSYKAELRNTETEGLRTLVIHCSKHQIDCEVTTGVSEATITEIEPQPNRVTFTVGEAFTAAGGKLLVKYSDGTEKIITLTTEMCTIDPGKMQEEGTPDVKVTYQGKEATFKITVVARIDLESLTVTPTSKTYCQYDTFDINKAFTLTAHYSNGASKVIPWDTQGVTYGSPQMDKAEPQTLNVEYAENNIRQTTTYTVIVVPAICRIQHEDKTISYFGDTAEGTKDALQRAVNEVVSGETIEMLVSAYDLANAVSIPADKHFTLKTAEDIEGLAAMNLIVSEGSAFSFEAPSEGQSQANVTFKNLAMTASAENNTATGIDNAIGKAAITLDNIMMKSFGIAINSGAEGSLNLSGNIQINENTKNVNLIGNAMITVTGDLAETASIGVTAEGRMAAGQQFGTISDEVTAEVKRLERFHQDSNKMMIGALGTDKSVIWKTNAICQTKDKDGKVINTYNDSSEEKHDALANAIAEANNSSDSGMVVEMLVSEYEISAPKKDYYISIEKAMTITTATSVGGPCTIKAPNKDTSADIKNIFQIEENLAIDVTMSNLNFNGNGGVSRCIFHAGKGTLTVKGCSINGFSVKKTELNTGSAIDVRSGGRLVLKDSEITNCSVDEMWVTADDGTKNKIGGYGGAIYLEKRATLEISGSKITGCSADIKGGAIASDSYPNKISISGSTEITGCTAGENGGGIYADQQMNLTVAENVRITNNTAGSGEPPSANNVYLAGGKNNITIGESGLGETAAIGITANSRMQANAQFGVTTNANAVDVGNLDRLTMDGLEVYVGAAKGPNNNAVIWRDQTAKPVCQLKRGETVLYQYYGENALESAVGDAEAGDTIEMLIESYTAPTKTITVDKSLTITKASEVAESTLKGTVSDGSGLFTVTGESNVSFTNLTLTTEADKNNRAITHNGKGTVTLTDTVLKDFKNGADGGAVNVKNGTLTLNGSSKVKDCSAKSYGGGLRATDGATINLEDQVTIENCSSEKDAGGISMSDGTKLNINSSDKKVAITNCSVGSDKFGGGIKISSGCTVDISGLLLSNCLAKSGGGIYVDGDATVVIANTSITGCKAESSSGSGGGIYTNKKESALLPNVTLTGVTFEGCSSEQYGGAITALSGTFTLNESRITRSTAVIGGAIRTSTEGTLNIEDTTIEGNTTTSIQNGIIDVGSAKLNIKGDTKIINNTEAGIGAVHFSTSGNALNIEGNVQIIGNTTSVDGQPQARNLYLAGKKNLTVTGNLEEGASIGVTAENRMAIGDQFGEIGNNANGLEHFYQDGNERRIGTKGDGNKIIWKDDAISGITILTKPVKLVYNVGEDFTTDGGVLRVLYENTGQVDIPITPEMCTGQDLITKGTKTITVTYGEKTATYPITVINPVRKIVLSESEPPMNFVEGQPFSVEGGVLDVTYQNGSTEQVAMDLQMCSKPNMTEIGEQKITVTLDGKTTDYQITIHKKASEQTKAGIETLVSNVTEDKWLIYELSDCFQNPLWDPRYKKNESVDRDDKNGLWIDGAKLWSARNAEAALNEAGVTTDNCAWKVQVNNKSRSFSGNTDFNGDKYGYSIFWIEEGLTDLDVGRTLPVIRYDTGTKTYEQGTIKIIKDSTHIRMDATTYKKTGELS